MNELKNTLSTIIYQLVANALLKSSLLGIAVGVIARLCGFSLEMSGIFGLLGFGFGAWFAGLFQDKKPQAIGIMHRLVGDAEYSLPLLEKDELNIAEQLQLARLNERIQTVRIPASRYLSVIFSKTGFYGLPVLLSVAVYYGYPLLKSNPVVQNQLTKYVPVLANDNRPVAPTFQSALLQIQPPTYTGLPVKESSDLNASAVSGSLLKWQLTFSESAAVSVRLVNSRGEEVAFKKAGTAFEYRDKLVSSGIYAIKGYWKTPGGKDSLIYQSDYYRLEAQPDLAPEISRIPKKYTGFIF